MRSITTAATEWRRTDDGGQWTENGKRTRNRRAIAVDVHTGNARFVPSYVSHVFKSTTFNPVSRAARACR